MAITKILARKGRLDVGIRYVLNGDKTQEQILTARLNCDPGHECRQILETKRAVGKEGGVQYYHLIQSFQPGEVTPELALEIAREFAEEHLPGYQTVIGVHVDKEHIHAHILFNSVNADTGEKYHSNAQSYCADCGGKMYVHRTNNGKRISQYTCSNYTKVPCGTLCLTQHRINESAVLTLVSDTLRAIAEYSRNDRTEFIHTVQETQVAQQSADISKKRRHLATAQKRAGELEKLICKIYEDNALGKLPDTRYKALDAQYAKEQDALEIEIAELEKAVTGYEQSQKSAEKFIALIDKYENFDTLTNTMLNEFVEKILVHERSRKGSQDTTQEIEIYFNFLGRYIPPSLQPVPLTPEEQEELRKREERKDRLHQNYLKRKASGAQKRYEDKIKAKKKAEMDAKKALIRAEDMKKGVFSTIGQLPKEEPRKGSIAASAAV